MSPRAARRGTVISVYSGAGGLDVGLEHAGFDPVLCLDTDPAAQQTLLINRPQWNVADNGEVSEAAGNWSCSDLGIASKSLDLLAGGPPCQPFSKAAQWVSSGRAGLKDPRTGSLAGVSALIEKFTPRAILIENVPGFVTGPSSALKVLEMHLTRINKRCGTGYRLQHWIVDAADYGVPQRRRRAILVAFRDGRVFELPAPTHVGQHLCAWDALHDYTEDCPPARTGTWTALLPSIPEGMNYQWHTARGGGEEIFGWRTRYWSFLLKLAKNQPAWTLPASPGPNTGPFHWGNRPLSTQERLRLQSFPETWKLVRTRRDQWKLVGNATPPLLAEVVGRAIADELGLTFATAVEPTLAIHRASTIPPPEPIQPISSRFASMLGPKAAHPGEGLGPSPRVR